MWENGWLVFFLVVAGILFALKIIYVVSAAGVLPKTGGALYVPTTGKRIEAALDVLALSEEQVLYDLGCGDGRVLRAAYRRFGVRAVGFEINPLAWFIAKIGCWGLRGVSVRRRDFRKVNLAEADVICCYLFPEVMTSLSEKLALELKPGAWLISFNFPLPGWHCEQIIRPDGDRHKDPIYFYRKL